MHHKMHHPNRYVLSLYWAKWAKVWSTFPTNALRSWERVSEWRCDGWEGRHSMQRVIYLTTRSRRWDHWPKWKVHGAVREKGDLILTPEHRAGEKGVEGGSKTKEGATMQRRRPWTEAGGKDMSHSDASLDAWQRRVAVSRVFHLTES